MVDSRVIIQQAKGVPAERYGLTVEEAFEMLRRDARAPVAGVDSRDSS